MGVDLEGLYEGENLLDNPPEEWVYDGKEDEDYWEDSAWEYARRDRENMLDKGPEAGEEDGDYWEDAGTDRNVEDYEMKLMAVLYPALL